MDRDENCNCIWSTGSWIRHSRWCGALTLVSLDFYKLLILNFSEALRRKILIHLDKLNYAINFWIIKIFMITLSTNSLAFYLLFCLFILVHTYTYSIIILFYLLFYLLILLFRNLDYTLSHYHWNYTNSPLRKLWSDIFSS